MHAENRADTLYSDREADARPGCVRLFHLYNDKAYKVIAADQSIVLNGFYDEKQLKNGNTRQVRAKATIPQSLIITFSRKQFEYQRAVRNRQIERAKKLLAEAKDPEDVKKGSNDIRRFIKRKKTKAEENMTVLSRLQTISNIHLDKLYYRPKDLDIMIKKLVKK